MTLILLSWYRDYNQDGVIDYDEFCYIYNEVSAEQSYVDYSSAAAGGGGAIASSIDAFHDPSLTSSKSQFDLKGNTGIFNVNVMKCLKLRDPTTGMFAAFTYANPYIKVGFFGAKIDEQVNRAKHQTRVQLNLSQL